MFECYLRVGRADTYFRYYFLVWSLFYNNNVSAITRNTTVTASNGNIKFVAIYLSLSLLLLLLLVVVVVFIYNCYYISNF